MIVGICLIIIYYLFIILFFWVYPIITMAVADFSLQADRGPDSLITSSGFCKEKHKFKKFVMFLQNIRCVNKNFDSFHCDIISKDVNFDILCLSETWAKYGGVQIIPGCVKYEHSSKYNKSSGVSLLVKKNWNSKCFNPDYLHFNNCIDIVAVSIMNFHHKIANHVICGCYRSPSRSFDEFLIYWEYLLNKFNEEKLNVTLLGDFNINILEENTEKCCSFRKSTYNAGFRIVHKNPTRIVGESISSLDLIITNVALDTFTCIVETDITDHMLVISSFDTEMVKQIDRKTIGKTVLNESASIEQLLKTDFSDIENIYELDAAFAEVNKRIQFVLEQNVMHLDFRNRYVVPINKWMTPGILISLKRKELYYKKWKKKPLRTDLRNRYFEYKKILDKTIKNAKQKYFQRALRTNKSDPSATWRTLNKLVKNIESDMYNIDTLRTEEGITLKEDKRKANYANGYFTGLKPGIQADIPKALKYVRRNPSTIFLTPIDECEVSHVIREFKNKRSKGVDGLSNWLIKKLPNLTKTLTMLGNKMLKEGVFPKCLKMGIIKVKYKAGEKNNIRNYRPITILPTFSKIYEKILCNRMWNFIDKCKILNKKQFGFRKASSTEDAILHLVTKIQEYFEKGEYALAMSWDISKAFDSVPHNLLLGKLHEMGFRGQCLKILKSYLEDRQVCTDINGCRSNFREIRYGVPQGSILGPLLFIIFTNDIFALEEEGDIVLYADDNVSLLGGPRLPLLKLRFSKWVENIEKWYTWNGMQLNITKTKFIIFGLPRKLSILGETDRFFYQGNVRLTAVEEIKYLGIWIHCSLSWKLHIADLSKRLQCFLPTLYRLRRILVVDTLLLVVKAIMIPKIDYCLGIYGNTYMGFLKGLNVLIKKAVRIIFHLKPHHSVSAEMGMLKIFNVNQMYVLHILQLLKKNVVHGNFSTAINLVKVQRSDKYALRNVKTNIFEKPIKNSVLLEQCLNYRLTVILNFLNNYNIIVLQDNMFVINNTDLKSSLLSIPLQNLTALF